MENTHNQRIPSANQNQVREEDLDIVEGARETDQLDTMKENAEQHPSEDERKEGTPASVKINDGSRDKGDREQQ